MVSLLYRRQSYRVLQKVNPADLRFDHNRFLKERLQTQALLIRFQEDDIAHNLLFLIALD
jgi:hypothetical protein